MNFERQLEFSREIWPEPCQSPSELAERISSLPELVESSIPAKKLMAELVSSARAGSVSGWTIAVAGGERVYEWSTIKFPAGCAAPSAEVGSVPLCAGTFTDVPIAKKYRLGLREKLEGAEEQFHILARRWWLAKVSGDGTHLTWQISSLDESARSLIDQSVSLTESGDWKILPWEAVTELVGVYPAIIDLRPFAKQTLHVSEDGTVSITLPDNSASTGYEWEILSADGAELKTKTSRASDAVGSSGNLALVFSARDHGSIKIGLRRSWEKSAPIEVREYCF